MNTTNEAPTQNVISTDNVWVPIDQVTVPEDARKHTPEDIDSRAVSLTKEGQLENILLSKEGGKLVLVYGNGRLESAKKAGWERIRADIKEGLSEVQKLMMTLAENEEREEASPFYTASLYARIIAAEHLSADGLAEKLGKKRSNVYNYLSLAKLAPEVQEKSNRLDIGLRHWLEIAKLPNSTDQIRAAQECADKDLSVRELQIAVQKRLGEPVEKSKGNSVRPTPGFHFVWKGDRLAVKGLWQADGKGPVTLSEELLAALSDYLQGHPCPAPQEAKAA